MHARTEGEVTGCTTKETKGTVPLGRKKKGSEADKSIYPTNLKNRMLQGDQGKDGGCEVPFRHRNGCICAIDILAELFLPSPKGRLVKNWRGI